MVKFQGIFRMPAVRGQRIILTRISVLKNT